MQVSSHSRSHRRRRARRSKGPSVFFLLFLVCTAALIAGIATARLSALLADKPSAESPDSVPSASQSDAVLQPPRENSTQAGTEPTLPVPDTTVPGVSVPMQAAEPPWYLTLVNWEHPLPEDFTAPKLIQLRNNQAIDERAYPDLQEMMDAARAEGLQPLICSSFRTFEEQTELYQNEVAQYLTQGFPENMAEERAAIWVAQPGTSEHEMGLAVDIVDTNYQILDQRQENTAVQKWLMEHCWEYGFILRYPTDKSAITHIGYEPWHYRYVGKEAAKAITESGLCLEEYLERYGNGYSDTEEGTIHGK